MPKFRGKNTNGISVEFDFIFRISNEEMRFEDYKRKINNYLSERRPEFNNLYFIQNSLFEHIVKDKVQQLTYEKNNLVYLTNYKETESSFLITFSIAIFTMVMNYSQLRDGMKLLESDLEFILKDIFPRKTKINGNYRERPNEYFENFFNNLSINIAREMENKHEKLNHDLRNLKRLFIIALTFIILITGYIFVRLETFQNVEPKISKSELRHLIKIENDEKESREKIDKIYNVIIELKKDSIN